MLAQTSSKPELTVLSRAHVSGRNLAARVIHHFRNDKSKSVRPVFLSAGSIMTPINMFKSLNGPIPQNCVRMREDDVLSRLVDSLVSSKQPVVIVDGGGQTVGVVSQHDVLASIVENRDD